MNMNDEAWYYIAQDTSDSDLAAVLSMLGVYSAHQEVRALKSFLRVSRVGVSPEAVRRLRKFPVKALPAPDGWDQRLKTVLENILQRWTEEVKRLRPVKVDGFPAADALGRQRKRLLANLDSLPQQIRAWALQFVRDNPARAAAMYCSELRLQHPLVVSRLALDAISGRATENLKKQDRTDRLAQRMHKSMHWSREQLSSMPHGGLTSDQADLDALALAAHGGLYPFLTGVLSLLMLRMAVSIATLLLENSPRQVRQLLAELTETPEGVCLTEELAKLPVWGEYQGILELCGQIPVQHWHAVLLSSSITNGLMDALGEKLTEVVRQAKTDEKTHKTQQEQLQRELKEANRKLRRLEGKDLPAPASDNGAKTASAPVGTDELSQLARRNTQLKQDVVQLQEQVTELRQLLDSVLRDTTEVPVEANPLTPAELKEVKGIIVGGHQNFTYKLRKLMPKCLYYSADHRRIDAAAFPDRDFVLFFTGYCNHALFENALRECRQHAIPVGYSTRVNLDLFLEEVGRLARSKPATDAPPEMLAVSSS